MSFGLTEADPARAQIEIDGDNRGLPRALALVICQKVEPPSCIGRAENLGLLVPASCLFHLGAHPYHAEPRKHVGIVGRARCRRRVGVAGVGGALQYGDVV